MGKNPKSETVLASYLRGDNDVTIYDVEKAELEDAIEYYSEQYSFNSRPLKTTIHKLLKFFCSDCLCRREVSTKK